MNLTNLFTILGCVAAGVVAWSVGGALGTGVIVGALLGMCVSALCVARLRLAARKDPRAILRVALEGFLIKLGFLLIGGLSFGLLQPLRERVDVRGFLVAFAVGAVLVLVPGTLETVRGLTARRPEAATGAAKT